MRSTLSQNQRLDVMKEFEAGKTISEICETFNISESTFRRIKGKYDDENKKSKEPKKQIQISDAKPTWDMERELTQYKQIVAEQVLEIRKLKQVIDRCGFAHYE